MPDRPQHRALGSAGLRDLSGTAFGDVAIGLVPPHCALDRGGHGPRLETQFALRAQTIHKHHVPRDLYAFDRDARFTADSSGKYGICIGYAKSEAVRNF